MVQPSLPANSETAETSQDGLLEISNFPSGASKDRFGSQIVNIDRRTPSNTVFHIDDNSFTSSMPRATHWSIAWSDLMMTMFVLFLSMFVYQMANEDFLQETTPEIIGGDTTEALQSLGLDNNSFPFSPIRPGLPVITSGTLRKAEPAPSDEFRKTEETRSELPEPKKNSLNKEIATAEETLADAIALDPEKFGLIVDPEADVTIPPPLPEDKLPVPADTVMEPRPLVAEESTQNGLQNIYNQGQRTLSGNNLDKFAAIELIPDKTMRIVLTGDLLFELGESTLSTPAKNSLRKIATAIRKTPYMINVVGHTDNIPMSSDKFENNWSLSVARATSVAMFMIDDTGMSPNQFVVSGFSSYRPVVPNNSAKNRAKNRRVEIIISKRLPSAAQATTENFKLQ